MYEYFVILVTMLHALLLQSQILNGIYYVIVCAKFWKINLTWRRGRGQEREKRVLIVEGLGACPPENF